MHPPPDKGNAPAFVGLTGGIAAGKSEALAAFARLGAATLSSDALVHELLDDPDVRSQCLARLDQLVVKPVDGSGGHGIVVGPQASDGEMAAVREQVLAEPRGWIAQELVLLSTSPAQLGDQLLPRHVDLRPFAVNDGAQVRVLPGGLTRVALREGSLIVNSSQGGGSKDTWVLTSSPGRDAEADGASAFPPQAVRGAEPDRGPHQDQQQ